MVSGEASSSKWGFRRTVLIIYGISFALFVFAVILVNLRDEQAGLFLILLGAGAVIFTQKLGYFGYLAYDKIYGWFRDVSDVASFTRDLEAFLASRSKSAIEEQRGTLVKRRSGHGYAEVRQGDTDDPRKQRAECGSQCRYTGNGVLCNAIYWTSDDYKPWAQKDRNDLRKLELPLLIRNTKRWGPFSL